MKTNKLIEILKTLPPDAEVKVIYDGVARTEVDYAWLARSGFVVLGAGDEPVYWTEDRPHSAPTDKESMDWEPREMEKK